MPEPLSPPPWEPPLDGSIADAARVIALWRLAFFILVALAVFTAILFGADEGGGLPAAAIAVAAVFLGSLLAGLFGIAVSAGAGSHSSHPVEKPMQRRVALAFRLVSGGTRILS